MIWAQRLIPTMTNYHHGGNLSAMIMVGYVYKQRWRWWYVYKQRWRWWYVIQVDCLTKHLQWDASSSTPSHTICHHFEEKVFKTQYSLEDIAIFDDDYTRMVLSMSFENEKNFLLGWFSLDEEGISLSGLCGWTDYLGRGRNCNVCKWWSFKYLFFGVFNFFRLIFYIWPDCYSQNMSQSLADSTSLFCCCWIGRFAILSGSVGRIVMPAVSKSGLVTYSSLLFR